MIENFTHSVDNEDPGRHLGRADIVSLQPLWRIETLLLQHFKIISYYPVLLPDSKLSSEYRSPSFFSGFDLGVTLSRGVDGGDFEILLFDEIKVGFATNSNSSFVCLCCFSTWSSLSRICERPFDSMSYNESPSVTRTFLSIKTIFKVKSKN